MKRKVMEEVKKLLTKENMVVLILGGILLLVIAWPTEDSSGKREGNLQVEETKYTNQMDALEYKEKLEKELEDFLYQSEGVGKVKVLIALETSFQRKPVESASFWGESKTQQETLVFPVIQGVVVVAQGAGNAVVKKDIMETVECLLGLEANAVKVVKMKRE